MSLTISLERKLSDRLQVAATARSVSPDQMVHDVLGAFLDKIDEEEQWQRTNARRIESFFARLRE